jgi:uncharacterized spore protein YtfJ
MKKITNIIKRRITTTIMGQDVKKCGTMIVRISKIFAGSRGGFFKKSPWPPEALENE